MARLVLAGTFFYKYFIPKWMAININLLTEKELMVMVFCYYYAIIRVSGSINGLQIYLFINV